MSELVVDLPDGWHVITGPDGSDERRGVCLVNLPLGPYWHFAYVKDSRIVGIGGHADKNYFLSSKTDGTTWIYVDYAKGCYANLPEAEIVRRLNLQAEKPCDWSELELQ